MNAHSSRTFKSGNSEAVRLPKGLGFGIGTDVRIERDGDRVVLTAVATPETVRASMRQLIDDLRAIRGDVVLPRQPRERFEFPDRERS